MGDNNKTFDLHVGLESSLTPDLIRLSIDLEHNDDIIEALDTVLAKV